MGGYAPFCGSGVQLGAHVTQCGLGRGLHSHQVASWSIQPFGHNRHGLKIGGGTVPSFFAGGRAKSPSITMRPGSRPTSTPSGILIYPAIWMQQTWIENWGDSAHFLGRGAGSPSNTMWPGPRPTHRPNFILIRPTIWPQCSNVTDRQDRQTDRQTGQRSDSIGRMFYKWSPKKWNA